MLSKLFGVKADRENSLSFEAFAKGSFLNKLILVTTRSAFSAFITLVDSTFTNGRVVLPVL